jgi:two-component system, OmpR family, phosphate regulon sensor histidine kinase PhoR
MKTRKLLWQLFPSYLIIILLVLAIINIFSFRIFREVYIGYITNDLVKDTNLIEHFTDFYIETGRFAALQDTCNNIGHITNFRTTIILNTGRVICDSEVSPQYLENLKNRPELQKAFKGKLAVSFHKSKSLNKEMLYVVKPLLNYDFSKVTAVIRLSIQLEQLNSTMFLIAKQLIWAALITIAIAAILTYMNAQRISVPLETIRKEAIKFACGDTDLNLPPFRTEEIHVLGDTLNRIAAILDNRIETITKQRNEIEAVLACMGEGVIAYDNNQNLISINNEAKVILDLKINLDDDDNDVKISNIIKLKSLYDFTQKTLKLKQNRTLQEDIEYNSDMTRKHLHLTGRSLTDQKIGQIGGVVVINDVTQVKKLEQIRSDFVGNVSHELRTPLTSIQGFIETLLDEDMTHSKETRKFLDIIKRQAHQLHAIINDLLTLSTLEQKTKKELVTFDKTALFPIVKCAIDMCMDKHHAKKPTVSFDCANNIVLEGNAGLLEQAIINIVDNAIKYSPKTVSVDIRCREYEKNIVITINDNGPGIASEHLPRLFERFYRVDKGRSRALGGTGLGLAIVKHIVHVHQGQIFVESKNKTGSCFTIMLPKKLRKSLLGQQALQLT